LTVLDYVTANIHSLESNSNFYPRPESGPRINSVLSVAMMSYYARNITAFYQLWQDILITQNKCTITEFMIRDPLVNPQCSIKRRVWHWSMGVLTRRHLTCTLCWLKTQYSHRVH